MSRPSVAVVGASEHRHKFGNKCVRAFLHRGFEVYPINPHSEKVEGLTTFASLAELPIVPDRISLYLPPHKTRKLLVELSQYPGAQVWFNPGSATAEILADARAAGIDVRDGCSIVDIGLSPSQFP